MAASSLGLWQRFWVSGTMLTRLITINALVWFAVLSLMIIGRLFIPELLPYSNGTFFLATYADLSILIKRPWTIVTHMFTHAGFFHIFFNMMLLYYLGNIFQGYLGERKLLSTYLMGGLAGFLAFFLIYNGSGALDATGKSAIGASAAVMAVFVATATYFPDMQLRFFVFNIKLKYLAIAYVLFDFVALNGVSNVGGHAGHLGGALYGFLLVRLWQKGTNLNSFMERTIDFLAAFFKTGQPKMKVSYKKSAAAKAKKKTDEEFNAEKRRREQRIDDILDKISKAGYDSLTKDEKDYLFRHSKDI